MRRPPMKPAASFADPLQPIVAAFAHNVLARTPLLRGDMRAVEGNDLVRRLAARAAGLRWPLVEKAEDELVGERLRRALRRYVRTEGPAARRAQPQEPVRSNLQALGRILELDPVERAVVTFLVAAGHHQPLHDLVEVFGDLSLIACVRLLATILDESPERVGRALEPKGRLRSRGLLGYAHSLNYLTHKFELKEGLVDLVMSPERLTREQILARFLTEADVPSLCWGDFEHLQQRARVARDLLGAAAAQGQRGVNVLFYGPTGTGKTQLARLLARELGLTLYAIGKADSDGESASASERLTSLLLGHQLLGHGRALLLFDEFEDLFEWESFGPLGGGTHGTAKMSKQWFNDALENNPVPTIWVTNRASGIDPAYLRRFLYAVEFEPLGAKQRARILRHHLGAKSAVASADVEAIAQRYSASPAQFGSAVMAARLLSGDKLDRETIENVLAPVEKLVTGEDPARKPVFETRSYSLEALNCSENLPAIADRLAGWKPGAGPGVSMCLYGPPGAGKSEFVKYLGLRMGRRVVYRRASDIQSCWVGETEKNIAQAFREAEHDDALLLFDEVDSFLRDRRTAQRSWEVSFVNEFLQQLECFQGVVACTTNLWRDLDEASLRRFVLKLEFRYLRPEQALVLFRNMFAQVLKSPLRESDEQAVLAGLSQLGCLTPGDFAAVARRATALREQLPFLALLDLLVAEVRVKGAPVRSLGFGTKV